MAECLEETALSDGKESIDHNATLMQSRVPWLSRLPRPWTATFELWRYGLVVLTSDDHQILSALASAVLADERLSVQIFTCLGSAENG